MTPEVLLDRARQAHAAGRCHRAARLCEGALNAGPNPALVAALRLVRAQALAAAGDWSGAALDCRRSLERVPSAVARALLGECLVETGDGAQAVAEIADALAAGADDAHTLRVYARALSAQGRHDEAVAAATRARIGDGGLPAAKAFIQVLASAGRHDEVIRVIEGELGAVPRDADLWTTLGLSFNALGQSQAGVAALQEAIALEPRRVEANCGLGMALLRLGRLSEGFRHNEYRQGGDAGAGWRLGMAPWRGEPLAGAHLMVLSEQGLGDTIQFARFVPMVRRLAGRVTFQVPPLLRRLFLGNPGLGDLATGHPGFGTADYQALVMSLPHLLGLQNDFGAAALPCLFPEPDRVDRWRACLPPGPRIALSWQGNPKYAGEPWRSMPFAHFGPLFERWGSNVTWLSLQKHFGREQLHVSPYASHVLDLGDRIDGDGDAFVDSLAILSFVDLFITTDTGLAHLAGSAGIPTWILLSEAADWRWEVGGERSSWYPTARLFRQTTGGDWDGVIRRVGDALEAQLRDGQAARQSGSKSIAECSIPPQVVGAGA